MILQCVQNDPAKLANWQRLAPAGFETVYPLTIGLSYPIVGMMLYSTVLWVLVEDDNRGPLMAPVDMFRKISQQLPEGWWFRAGNTDASIVGEPLDQTIAVWGYAELVENPDHYSALTEWEESALASFRVAVLSARTNEQG